MFLKKNGIYLHFSIDPLCNGSTADFGSVSWGSSPYGSVCSLIIGLNWILYRKK